MSANLIEAYKSLKRELNDLVYFGQFIRKYCPNTIVLDAYIWTILKLIFLKTYVYEVYTPIIKNNYRHMFYIDLFAGPGLNRLREYPNILSPGSPIITWMFSLRPFDYMYFIDKNQEYLCSLRTIFNVFAIYDNKYENIHGDANEKYKKILEDIEQTPSSHFLAFIDPFGFEINWNTIEDLLTSKVRGDLIILLQYQRIAQHVGNVMIGKNIKKLDAFFGDEYWIDEIKKLLDQGYNKREAVIKYYKNKILSCHGRDRILLEINIKKTRKVPRYSLLFVTNKTIRGNPWLEKVNRLKELVENDPKFVDGIISDVYGSQKLLLSFLK